MRTSSISGKLTQLSNLPFPRWSEFVGAWWRRGSSGHVPCVLPRAERFIHVPLQDFYETYWFFSESKQGLVELGFFVSQLRPGDIVFDIGAFRGAYGAAAKAALGDTVLVHLFEPVPKNLEAIRVIAHLNQLKGFEIVDKAVGGGALVSGILNGEDDMLRPGNPIQDSRSVSFPSTSVDAYIAKTGITPTVMKIDVEGFEMDVLHGAQKCLVASRPRLWLETHPTYLAAQGKRWEEVIEFLKALGYKRINFFDDYELPAHEMGFHLWCEA